MSRILNFVFGFGLLGVLIMALIAPFVISVLFTPPVSFGSNCEPAATWSMQKLHTSEAAGAFFGMLLGLIIGVKGRRRGLAPKGQGQDREQQTNQDGQPK